MGSNAKARRNLLDPKKTHRTVQLLIELKEEFDKNPLTADELARKISDLAGFMVNRGNIYHTATRLGYSFKRADNTVKSKIRELLLAGRNEEAAVLAADPPPPARAGLKPGMPPIAPPEASDAAGRGRSVMDRLAAIGTRLDGTAEKMAGIEERLTIADNSRDYLNTRIERLEAEVAELRQLIVALYRDLGSDTPA